MYTAWLTFGDSFKDVYFPDQQNWNSRVALLQNETGWEYDVYIAVRALDGRVYIAPTAPLTWRDGSRREHEVSGDAMFNVVEGGSRHELTVIIKQCERQWLEFTKYRIPRRKLTVGRSERADIRDSGVLMTAEHGYIGLTQEGYVRYQDHSSNGTYLNGRKLLGNTARLKFGDVLAFLTGLKIVYLDECIAVNRTAGTGEIALERWTARKEKQRPEDGGRELPSVYQEIQRPPRMLLRSAAEDTDIEGPIPKQNANTQSLMMQIGPSMTMVLPMLMGSLFASRGGSMLSGGLVMISTSSALAVMWGLINRRYRKNQELMTEQRRVSMYRRYIAEVEESLRKMNEGEYRRLLETFPDAGQCAGMPAEHSGYLWNRMPSHPDFMHVRIGTGEVEMPCAITTPKQKLSIVDDELRSEPERLKQLYSSVSGAPVTLSLREEAVVGVLGGMAAVRFAQGLLMQIAALHSYHDVRIAVLTDSGSVSQWAWTRWLPHVFTSEDRELRMVASNAGDIHDVVSHLDEVLSIRKSNAANSEDDDSEEKSRDELPLPHYVVFCTNCRILEDEPTMRQLLTNRFGMTLVVIGENMTHLPKECRMVLNLQGGDGYLHSSEGDTRKIDFEYPDGSLLKGFARSMAPLRVRDVAENAAIPTLVSFLDIYNVRRVEELEVWRMWNENHTYEGLKSIVGYRAGSQPFVLDISEKYHGPHGLIAGTTGSGKSVMLETYILSLALNYSPKQVQFILIDYKGGGMADSFRELPHVAGVIDNLQGPRVIDRALASLKGEIHRRELIFKSVKINNITDYARQYGDEPGMEMPHLIIIVDEFAELKSEQPEFMSELVSASRVGRSLGIHLILATQKPSNSVSDEIWANCKFHLCLRVQTRQDSMEMLKRPDAAYIKGMGRCFIQIGNDELFEQVQTSYSGLDYRPDEPRAEEMPQMLTNIGHTVRIARRAKSECPSQMSAVLRRIYEVAAENGMDVNRQLWIPEMPRQIYLENLELFRRASWDGGRYPNPQGDIRMLAGLADDVANQRYLPYVINLTESHNLILNGLAGTGKTTLEQSLVYSLCSMYDPEHIHIYILSLTSKTLGNLAAFPQVGDIAFDGDTVEIKRFINMLYAEMLHRAKLFAAASTDSFVEYNAAKLKHGQKPEPAVVVFVDRYVQLREMFANDDFYTNRIQQMIQEGSGRGIHFVVTAMAKNEVPSKLHPFFGGVALQLKDRSDYSDTIGRRVPYDMPPIANIVGRGLGVLDEGVYEIQLAMGGGAPEHRGEDFAPLSSVEGFAITHELPKREPLTDVERAEGIAAYAEKLAEAWKGGRPAGIPRIPEKPVWQMLFEREDFREIQHTRSGVPVGYDMVQGTLSVISVEEAPSWLVYGPRRSGVSNFLKLMARVMKNRGSDVYVLADSNWARLAAELEAPLYSTPEDTVKFLQMFIERYAHPRKPLRDAALEKGKGAAKRQAAQFGQCCILIDNAELLYGEFSREPYKKHLPLVQGLLGEISEKLYYNFVIFMGVHAKERNCVMYDPVKSAAAQGRAIALGGKLSDFDPCGVGEGLNARIRGAALPLGHGFVGDNGEACQIVVPLAEQEEE